MIAAATLGVFAYSLTVPGIDLATAQTIAFTTLVVLEIARIYMIRSAYHAGMFSNKWLILAILFSVGLQLAAVYTPLGGFIRTVPLGLAHWQMIGIALVSVLVVGTIVTKLIRQIATENY